MNTKEPLRKQIIIAIAKLNTKLIINLASSNITNINKCLKNAKLDIITDFIYLTNDGVIITTNKPANIFDLSIIKKYMKNINNINLDNIDCLCLPKFKSYLKLHLFENIVLVSKPQVIKVSSKSDMVVV